MAVVSAGAIKAGEAYVALGTRDTSLSAGLRQARAKVQAFANSLTHVGMAMGGALLGGGMAFAPVIGQFMEFDYAMRRLGILTNATAEEFAALEKEARRVGAETVFTAVDAAKAMAYFSQEGFDVAEILRIIRPTSDMAAAGMLDLATAGNITTKIIRQFGLDADDATRAVDVLSKAITTGGTDLEQLGDAMKFVGAPAHAAGYSIEQVTAAIQVLGKAGIQADMAGTSLRGFFIALADPSEKAAAKLKQLGVSARDADGNFRPLADIVGDLARATAGKGGFDKLTDLFSVFPNRVGTGMTVLIDHANELREATAALYDATGSGARVAAAQMDTLYGSWKYLVSSIEGVAITIGQNLNPLLRQWADIAGVLSNAVRDWAGENQGLFAGIAKGALAAAGLAAGLLAIGVGLKVLMFAGSVATVLGTMAVAAALAYGAIRLLGADLSADVRLLGDAVSFVAEHFEGLGKAVTDTVSGLAEAIGAGELETAWEIAVIGMKIIWEETWKGATWSLMDLFTDFGLWIGKMFDNVIWGVQSGFIQAIGYIAKTWSNLMGWTGEDGPLAIQGALDKKQQQITDAANKRQQAMKDSAEEEKRQRKAAASANPEIDALKEQQRQKREGVADRVNWKWYEDQLAEVDKEQMAADWKWYQGMLAEMEGKLPNTPALETKLGVAGTFDSGIAGRMGVGQSQADRTAAATEETARNTRKIADSLGDGGFA